MSSVTSILNHLNWSSLEVRKKVTRLIMFDKILQGLVMLYLPSELSPLTAPEAMTEDIR